MQWFVENFLNRPTTNRLKILDVGSFDVNGTYKKFFPAEKYDYVGLDMEPGPNVNLVIENPYNWDTIESDSFDVVISGQTFEHTEFFWITLTEMTRVLKKDGLLCIIAPKGFKEHRYPVDCYRFFTDGMIALARYVNLNILHAHTDCAPKEATPDWHLDRKEDSILVAQKPYSGAAKIIDVKRYRCQPANQDEYRGDLLPYDKQE